MILAFDILLFHLYGSYLHWYNIIFENVFLKQYIYPIWIFSYQSSICFSMISFIRWFLSHFHQPCILFRYFYPILEKGWFNLNVWLHFIHTHQACYHKCYFAEYFTGNSAPGEFPSVFAQTTSAKALSGAPRDTSQ